MSIVMLVSTAGAYNKCSVYHVLQSIEEESFAVCVCVCVCSVCVVCVCV